MVQAVAILIYLVFLGAMLVAIGFIGDLGLPLALDGPPRGGLVESLLVDSLLLLVFALQHSVMARPAFKRRWTRIVPPALERSAYVLASSLALLLLFWQWRPIGPTLWDLGGAVYAVYALGWAVVLAATFMIDHTDLFGLRQAFMGARYQPPPFQTRGLYRHVRHPLMLGFLIVIWAAPRMTVGHLVFAAGLSVYIAIGIALEERDLLAALGEDYRAYRARVGAVLPWGRR